MIENVKQANQLLYHYTTAKTAIDYIIKSRKLRFGAYTNTNDPKEKKDWEFILGTNEGRDIAPPRGEKTSTWLSNRLKGRTKLICFSMDRPTLTGSHIIDIPSRGFSKPRMWAQYAERHTGVCLVFDRMRLAALISKQFSDTILLLSGPVNYIDRSIVPNSALDHEFEINIDALEDLGEDQYARLHLQMAYKRLFFEKMIDWRDECEWRWVAFANDDEDIYVDFFDSLVGIVFGADVDEISVQSIKNATSSWNLRYMGLRWRNCSPWYDYENPLYWV